jgi:hypothetical protein
VAEGGRSRGGRQWRWNFNGTGYGRWKQEREGNGVRPFLEGRGGEARRLHNAVGGRYSEERRGGWRLEVEDD